MALRVLSGLVNVKSSGPKNGRVRIGFDPHQKISGDASPVERRTIGPAGRFISIPAKIIALRQISLIGLDPMADYKLRLGDTITRDDLEITWSGKGPAFSEEISYMVIGEVPDPPAKRVPLVRKPSKSKASRARRKKR
jgi:hypothetical protein